MYMPNLGMYISLLFGKCAGPLYPCHTTTTNSTSRHELIDYGIRQSLWTESLHSTNRLRYKYDIATNIRENRFDSA